MISISICAAEESGVLHRIEKLTRTEIEAMEHQYHSEQAKNAVGAAAETMPNKSRISPRGSRLGNLHESCPRKSHSARIAC
jgi:hypothetical protein